MSRAEPKIDLAEVVRALRAGCPPVIGYGEQSQKAFEHGWRAALDQAWGALGLSALCDEHADENGIYPPEEGGAL